MKASFGVFLLVLAAVILPVSSSAVTGVASSETGRSAAHVYGKLPLSFEPARAAGLYVARGNKYAVSIGATESSIVVERTKSDSSQMLRFGFKDANAAASMEPLEPLSAVTNYYVGTDEKNWRLGVRNYAKLRAKGIYPGVDVVYYGDQRRLEFDFIVAPNANPDVIAVTFSGMARLYADRNGDLVAQLNQQTIRFAKPVAYQRISGGTSAVEVSYLVDGSKVRLQVGSYDRRHELVIDPVVSATLLGGSQLDAANGIAVDGDGNSYVTGQTCSIDFPSTARLDCDAYLAKFASDGTRQYTTVVGGTAGDTGNAIALDLTNNVVYLAGTTSSSDLPDVVPGSTYATGAGSNAFVAALTTAGALLRSRYVGGSGANLGHGIAIDTSNAGGCSVSTPCVVLVGETDSGDFPFASAYQTRLYEGWAAFITKLNSAFTTMQFSTALSGKPKDASKPPPPAVTSAYGVAVDANGGIYLALGTTSKIFPQEDGALPPGAMGVKLTYQGSPEWSISLGTAAQDRANAVAVDTHGNSYYVGVTTASVGSTPTGFQLTKGGGEDAFLVKLSATGSPMVYGTLLGGSGNDSALAVAVDGNGAAYVTGRTASSDFPLMNPLAPNAHLGQNQLVTRATLNGPEDAFVAKFTPDGSALILSTYLGGGGADQGNAVAVDRAGAGDIYVAGTTRSQDFPVTTGATYKGNGDGFIALIPGENLPAVTVTPASVDFGNQDVNIASTEKKVRLTNTNSAQTPVTIHSISANGDFRQYNTIVGSTPAQDCYTRALVPGESCDISVVFTASAEGLRSGALTISDDALGSPRTIPLSGRGVSPFAVLNRQSVAFGSQPVSIASAPEVVQLANTGSGTLYLTSIATTGDFQQTNNCGMQVSAGASCQINVTFTPTAVDSRSGSLKVTDNASGSPRSVALSGSGLLSQVGVDSSSVTFGSVAVGQSSTQNLTVTNTSSTVLLSISGLNTTGDFRATGANCLAAPITPGGTCAVGVVFTPTATGSRTGGLTILANASNSPETVMLSGTGGAEMRISPISLSFGNQAVTTSSTVQNVVVTNASSFPLQIDSIAATGDFHQTNNCSQPIQGGGTCTIQVTFVPADTGNRSGTLTVSATAASNSSQTVALAGTGVPAAADFSMTPPSSAVSITAGQTGTFAISVAPSGGFSQTVNLACTAPSPATCSVTPTSLTMDGTASKTATVSITVPGAPTGTTRGASLRLGPLSALPLCSGLILIGSRRRRWLVAALLALVLSLLAFTACGGGGSGSGGSAGGGMASGSYSVTVTATYTGASTPTTHSISVPFQVK